MVLYTLILSSSFILYYYTTLFNNDDYTTIYATAQSSDEFLTYYNSAYGIRIQYPVDWGKTEGPFLQRLATNNIVPIVQFSPPGRSVAFSIVIEKLKGDKTIDQELKESISSFEKNQTGLTLIESNKTTLANLPAYKLLYNGTFDITAALNEFPELDKMFGDMLDFKPVNTTSLHYFTIRDGNEYIISYGDGSGKVIEQASSLLGGLADPSLGPSPSVSSVVPDPFSHYLPTAQRMIDSFSLDMTQLKTGQEANNTSTTFMTPDSDSSQTSSEQSQSNNEDPLLILKNRLARGEISIEEYNELQKIMTAP
jgi:PsbP-like protein